MQKLPVGISTFSDMREGNFVYVDKTPLIMQMLEGRYYFLSRPRRFGKSLLVDTIKEMFSGNRELFHGLAAYDAWDFQTYPVISINFAESTVESREELLYLIDSIIDDNAQRLGVELRESKMISLKFGSLIAETYKKYGKKVVILVDEYDQPLMNNLTTEAGPQIRSLLRNVYSVIKAHDARLRFVLLTGVSKFSKVSIFSGLNNLNDISLNPTYSTLCGYTQDELELYFKSWLQDVDLVEMKDWYNGYNWEGESVYNPYDVLLFFDNKKIFRSYWFETGTPSFLVKLLHQNYRYLPKYEDLEMSWSSLGVFDLEGISLNTLLFHSGYLTIAKVHDDIGAPFYQLSFPNTEVRSAFNQLMLSNYLLTCTPDMSPIQQALKNQNIVGIEAALRSLFASIANDNYRNNTISHYEGYYASVIYAYLASLGFPLIAEDATSTGRIDLSLKLRHPDGNDVVYIFEFKIADPHRPGSSIQQILDKNYAEKYRNPHTTIHLIGIEFDPAVKNITEFTHQQIKESRSPFE